MDNADIILNVLDHSLIHVERGLDLFGGQKSEYIEILEVVLKDGRKKIPAIRKYLNDNDIKDFMIEVHALKSVAANIGAENLSVHAKKIEQAVKAEDMEFIKENTDALLHLYEMLLENIEKALLKNENAVNEENEELPELTADEWNKAFSKLRQLIDDFEQDEAIELIDKILHHQTENEDVLKRLKEIREYLEEFDFQQALKLLK